MECHKGFDHKHHFKLDDFLSVVATQLFIYVHPDPWGNDPTSKPSYFHGMILL